MLEVGGGGGRGRYTTDDRGVKTFTSFATAPQETIMFPFVVLMLSVTRVNSRENGTRISAVQLLSDA